MLLSMLMSISAAVQIVQNTSDSLEIYFPPNYLGALWLCILTFFMLLLTFKTPGRLRYLFAAASLVCVFFALDFSAYHGRIVLSRPAQTLTLEERSFYYRHTNSYPLNSVEQAIVKAGRYQNREMALLLSSGQEIPVGNGYSSRGGEYQAANAINSFLARNNAER